MRVIFNVNPINEKTVPSCNPLGTFPDSNVHGAHLGPILAHEHCYLGCAFTYYGYCDVSNPHVTSSRDRNDLLTSRFLIWKQTATVMRRTQSLQHKSILKFMKANNNFPTKFRIGYQYRRRSPHFLFEKSLKLTRIEVTLQETLGFVPT